MHGRQQIRDTIAQLLTGLPLTGSRVEKGRTRPLPERHDPTLLIYGLDETAGRVFDGNPTALGRTLQVFIDCRVSVADAAEAEDLLDQIAEQVEGRLNAQANETLGGLVFDLVYAGCVGDVRAEGTQHKGALRLDYRVRYAEAVDDRD